MRQSEISRNSWPVETPEGPSPSELQLQLLNERMSQLEEQVRASLAALEALRRTTGVQQGQVVELLQAQSASHQALLPELERRLAQLFERASATVTELLPQVERRLQAAVTLPETPSSPSQPELETLRQELSTALEQLRSTTSSLASTPSSIAGDRASLQQRLEAWTTAHGPMLAELPNIASSLTRLEHGLATTRAELAAEMASRPNGQSTDLELLSELRMLWRKQELYVLGLQGGLNTALETSHQVLRTKVRQDLAQELEGLPSALGSVVRQALSAQPKASPLLPEVREPPRQPLVGVVVLSSLTSALVTAAMLWCLR